MIRGRTLYHCHGKEKGKPIRTFKTHRKAVKAHRAILASQAVRRMRLGNR